MSEIADTPEPPYYAVIFTSLRTEGDKGYERMSEKMLALASQQAGYLGIESAQHGVGITVSYWQSPEAIKDWKNNVEHLVAQEQGKSLWYANYKTRICRVERDYEMVKD
jgi:heme-degrading monooxygenase HmoA